MSEELLYFNEDAQEQLQMMESALLDALDKGANDEGIGTIFRAMHTIKGVAGMFSFDAIISFTHIAENLMDSVRNHEINATEELLTLMLRCKDHVAALVEAAVNSQSLNRETQAEDKTLKSLIGTYIESSKNETAAMPIQADSLLTLWHISLQLKEHFFDSGMDLLSILSYLGKMGTIHNKAIDFERVPHLENIDPFVPYVSFAFDFESSASLEEIVEVFEFVEDDIVLEVNKLTQALTQTPTTLEIDGFEILDDEEEQIEEREESLELATQVKVQEPKVNSHAPAQSLRVDSAKVDVLIDTISEMITLNAKIAQHVERKQDADLEDISLELETLLQTLRNNVMQIRMLSVGDSFEKFRRVVNDVARKLGKKIHFTITGGDTELDKTVIEKISDPLVHMLRNAVDHGIELPEVRRESGKNEEGKIELRAYPDSGSIVIEIEDDGKGLSREFLMQKAISKGLIQEGVQLSDAEAFALIFAPGFSTAEVVSDISGRGVGMDVVKKNIEALKGNVELSSSLGKGSRFTIRLPLTLAIIEGFLFQVGSSYFIVPLNMIAEVLELDEKYQTQESRLFDLRGTLLPLLDLREFYHQEERENISRQNVIVVRYANQSMGLVVDELFGENQTVVKSLGRLFKNAPAIYGASVLGNAEIALIMDIPALFHLVNLHKESK